MTDIKNNNDEKIYSKIEDIIPISDIEEQYRFKIAWGNYIKALLIIAGPAIFLYSILSFFSLFTTLLLDSSTNLRINSFIIPIVLILFSGITIELASKDKEIRAVFIIEANLSLGLYLASEFEAILIFLNLLHIVRLIIISVIFFIILYYTANNLSFFWDLKWKKGIKEQTKI